MTAVPQPLEDRICAMADARTDEAANSIWTPPALPRLFSESKSPARAADTGGVETPGIASHLLGAHGAAERERLVLGQLRILGFDWLSYGIGRSTSNGWVPLSALTSYTKAGWAERYFAERHYEVDPRLLVAPASGLPLIWDLQSLAAAPVRRGLEFRRERFLQDLANDGVRSGLYLRLATETGGDFALVSMMSNRADARWLLDNVVGAAMLLAASVHHYYSARAHQGIVEPAIPASRNSDTQNAILALLRQGRSDKEIAYQLQLSGHAVDYHMRRLRRRYGVRNRVQLAAAAALA